LRAKSRARMHSRLHALQSFDSRRSECIPARSPTLYQGGGGDNGRSCAGRLEPRARCTLRSVRACEVDRSACPLACLRPRTRARVHGRAHPSACVCACVCACACVRLCVYPLACVHAFVRRDRETACKHGGLETLLLMRLKAVPTVLCSRKSIECSQSTRETDS